jgi:hypothetical protein
VQEAGEFDHRHAARRDTDRHRRDEPKRGDSGTPRRTFGHAVRSGGNVTVSGVDELARSFVSRLGVPREDVVLLSTHADILGGIARPAKPVIQGPEVAEGQLLRSG